MPGTVSAISADAFSGYGSASPYDEDRSMPECADTITTSAPALRTRGTQSLASSTMPPNLTLFSTFALSQIAMPGLVRPRMPTVIGFSPGTCTRFSTYGGKTGRPVVQSWALAAEQREPQLPLELAQDVERRS